MLIIEKKKNQHRQPRTNLFFLKIPSVLLVACIIAIGLLLFTSCVTVRHNYLGKSNVFESDITISSDPAFVDSAELRCRSDYIVQTIVEDGKIKGREINQLYTSTGTRLNNDRFYNSVLQNGSSKTLSAKEYLAALELLSSASCYEKAYQNNPQIRRRMNRGDTGNAIPKNFLRKSRSFLYSNSVRKEIEKAAAIYEEPRADSILSLLPSTNWWKAFRYRFFPNNDWAHFFAFNVAHAISCTTGNTLGLFNYPVENEFFASKLHPQLRPFDIILVKSTNHLTDVFIPGYFGHAGIYMGNQLDPAKYFLHHHKMTGEKMVVESVRSGVRTSHLTDFADGNTFLVMRLKNLPPERKANIRNNIYKHLGKSYDFNFDILSPASITCTELVFLAFDFISWHTQNVWSGITVTPDDLARTALEAELFEFPVFIENDVQTINPDNALIQGLVNK
ncbi:Permuted papain-like amidase enzyme, YaeF/YiiX, C92 family [Mariniphaga anaerophila]|uniref:Permuted papain-like amidase enzyme, YaeF/YiiX, C92 family n=1 Tax=Mariniphaga anaerophila TaxID=1484053 RepID=A0A1M4TNP9_9BACT|nr:YiiX/YebB-like N1pC/P60 family cysteine hydrolase [Mariniphaga anaerophila]SHE46048.1 Permuted papain-like amidase enzyme, YaeF/YiiX, C92 family [Mariniphaga anaerophila]